MSLEFVNAIASVTTAVVIGATAIAAIIQLRHMRTNNQITALLAVQNELDVKDYRDADALIRREAPEIFEDEGFCEYMVAILMDQVPVENTRYLNVRQAARFVCNTYETMGTLVKKRIIDVDLLLDAYSTVLTGGWANLEGFVAMVRAGTGHPQIYENFEYAASLSHDYLASHPDTFPRDAKRLNPRVPAAAAKFLGKTDGRINVPEQPRA